MTFLDATHDGIAGLERLNWISARIQVKLADYPPTRKSIDLIASACLHGWTDGQDMIVAGAKYNFDIEDQFNKGADIETLAWQVGTIKSVTGGLLSGAFGWHARKVVAGQFTNEQFAAMDAAAIAALIEDLKDARPLAQAAGLFAFDNYLLGPAWVARDIAAGRRFVEAIKSELAVPVQVWVMGVWNDRNNQVQIPRDAGRRHIEALRDAGVDQVVFWGPTAEARIAYGDLMQDEDLTLPELTDEQLIARLNEVAQELIARQRAAESKISAFVDAKTKVAELLS